MSKNIPLLAIVIPAFKGDFLAKVLACVARQTDQRFTLYICDDVSPAAIQSIARLSLGDRHYIYKRFENNLGGVSLARHWDRCVAGTTEPWVWLFSDDDLMDDNCVEVFNKFLAAEPELADVVRFDGWMVDEHDKITQPLAFDPDRETWLEFAYGYLMSWRRSYIQRFIFRRSAYDRAGGFLDLPMCWATDDAAVIAFGQRKPICRIPGARVSWRKSGQNITPDHSLKNRSDKIRAICMFLQWLHGQLQTPREHLFLNDDAAFERALEWCLLRQIEDQGSLPALVNWNLLSSTRSKICGGSGFALLKWIAAVGARDSIWACGRLAKRLGA